MAVVAWGCVDESREAADDRLARALLAELDEADYRSWATMPGFEEARPSTGPHGQTVEIFVNRVLADALDDGGPWPVGSVAVKDGHAGDALIVRATIRRDEQGWFFALFDAEDGIVAAGRDPYCINCHDTARGYLLSAPRPTD